MTVSFNKASIAVAATLAVLVLANGVLGAPSLGYPAGRPYFGSSNQQSGARAYRNYAPSYSTADETRQSYSYEPSESGEAATESTAQSGCCCGERQADTKRAQDDVASKSDETRRSYSYEPDAQPATQGRTYRSRATRVGDPWQYQRTDPRRMGR
jgi:hypothetical protein